MATDAQEKTTPIETPTSTLSDDPNANFHEWLTMNNYEVSVDALTENNPYLQGKGFVLTDKPLLVVSIKKKEGKE